MTHALHEPEAAVHGRKDPRVQGAIHDPIEVPIDRIVWIGRAVPADGHQAARVQSPDCGGRWGKWLTTGPSMRSDSQAQALVAQRIRASDYGSEGREFESLQARFSTVLRGSFFLPSLGAGKPFPTIRQQQASFYV